MNNIQVIDGALNCVYDIFVANDKELAYIFQSECDIAFREDLCDAGDAKTLGPVFENIWKPRIPKAAAPGIHGTLFRGALRKKKYYPTLKDEEAIPTDRCCAQGGDRWGSVNTGLWRGTASGVSAETTTAAFRMK